MAHNEQTVMRSHLPQTPQLRLRIFLVRTEDRLILAASKPCITGNLRRSLLNFDQPLHPEFSIHAGSNIRIDSGHPMASQVPCNLLCACPIPSDPHLPVQFVAVQINPGSPASALRNRASNKDSVRRANITLPLHRYHSSRNKTDCSSGAVGRQPFA
jgi:hypothetical protein